MKYLKGGRQSRSRDWSAVKSISGGKLQPKWPGDEVGSVGTWGRGWKKSYFEFWRNILVSTSGPTFKTSLFAPKFNFEILAPKYKFEFWAPCSSSILSKIIVGYLNNVQILYSDESRCYIGWIGRNWISRQIDSSANSRNRSKNFSVVCWWIGKNETEY